MAASTVGGKAKFFTAMKCYYGGNMEFTAKSELMYHLPIIIVGLLRIQS